MKHITQTTFIILLYVWFDHKWLSIKKLLYFAVVLNIGKGSLAAAPRSQISNEWWLWDKVSECVYYRYYFVSIIFVANKKSGTYMVGMFDFRQLNYRTELWHINRTKSSIPKTICMIKAYLPYYLISIINIYKLQSINKYYFIGPT